MDPTKKKGVYLGLDIGGTAIKAVSFQLPDKLVGEFECASRASEEPEKVRGALSHCIRHFTQDGLIPNGVGIGCAGSVDHGRGVVRNSPNFKNWHNVPLREWVTADVKVAVTVENDANCAMFAEWRLGSARGCRNALLLTFGTGIGGGLILNEHLFRGSTGSAAELGHLTIHADGIACACGNTGCFERYCSGSALMAKFPEVKTVAEFFERQHDSRYQEGMHDFLHDMKVGITSLANVFDPDLILIGGGIAEGIAPHCDEIQTWVQEHAFPAVAQHVRIVRTKLKNLSGAIGAALLASETSAT